MTPIARLLLVVTVLTSLSRTLSAQDDVPKVTVMFSSANELLSDLEYAVSLTDAEQRQQWPTLEEYFEVFLAGIDRAQPVRIDALLVGNAVRFRSSFPIDDFRAFRDDNLDTFGISQRRRTATLYELTMNREEFGWMRYSDGFATIAEDKTDVPVNLEKPLGYIQPLLDRGYDAAVRMTNTDEGQEQRKTAFQRVREELLAAVKQKQGEDDLVFELRRLATEHQMNEGERFFVETKDLELGWTTDAAQKEGRLTLNLQPIEGTNLAQTVQQFNQAPSRFANVPKVPDAIMSLRVNHPLDEMRQQHFLEFFSKSQERTNARIDAADSPADVKTNRKRVAELFYQMLNEGVKAGLIDGFLEVKQHQSEKLTVVAGIQAADGSDMTEIIKLLESANLGENVQLEMEQQSDIAIHKVVVPESERAKWEAYLGDDSAVFVGTGKETVWLASGVDALPALKDAISQVAQPNRGTADAPFLELNAQLGPWMKLRDKRVAIEEAEGGGAANPPPAAEEGAAAEETELSGFEKLISDRSAMRKLAIESFEPGDDTLTAWMKREGTGIVGEMRADSGVLRLFGAILAKFSADNLADN